MGVAVIGVRTRPLLTGFEVSTQELVLLVEVALSSIVALVDRPAWDEPVPAEQSLLL